MEESTGTPAPTTQVPNWLKYLGGAVLMAASIALMIHRMPHHEYVAVHADKPRDKTQEVAAAPAAPAAPKAPSAPAAPVSRPLAAALPAASPLLPTAAAADAPAETEDWKDECRSEIGILCHETPAKQLVRCLSAYQDVMLRPCRQAYRRFHPPLADAD